MRSDDEDADVDAASPSPSLRYGITLLLLSLLCLGTWPAILRLCTAPTHDSVRAPPAPTGERSHLLTRFAQRRHPCHAYVDYALSYVAFSLTVPVLLGLFVDAEQQQQHDADSGPQQQRQHPWSLILIASLGGTLLSLGNLSTQWSTTVYAAPLTTVLALQASLCVALGTSFNYALEPDRTGRPALLLGGVLCFLCAIGWGVRAQGLYMRGMEGVGARNVGDDGGVVAMSDLGVGSTAMSGHAEYMSCRPNGDEVQPERDGVSKGGGILSKLHSTDKPAQLTDLFIENDAAGTNLEPFSIERTSSLAEERTDSSIPPRSAVSIGIIVAFFGGLCFGFFSPAFNISVNDPFQWSGGGGLTVATANACFGVAFALSSVLYNLYLMVYPPSSAPFVEPTTVGSYLAESFAERRTAFLAGIICALGNVLQFQGGKMAGYATSDLVQAFPLVATLWDVFLFGHFRGVPRRVLAFLTGMYLAYLTGICLLAASISV